MRNRHNDITKNEPLPEGILKADLKDVKWEDQPKDYDKRYFELWLVTGFGWVIPTLSIGSRRSTYGNRTYAVTIEGQVVRVGRGPHVLAMHTVHVSKKTAARLEKFFELRLKGQGDAGQIRDRISSRRAQGQQMRAEGRSYWKWNV
jgi:hypothetical protein